MKYCKIYRIGDRDITINIRGKPVHVYIPRRNWRKYVAARVRRALRRFLREHYDSSKN